MAWQTIEIFKWLCHAAAVAAIVLNCCGKVSRLMVMRAFLLFDDVPVTPRPSEDMLKLSLVLWPPPV